MQHLKIFRIEEAGPALIVTPHGDGTTFRYQELHIEANAIRGHLAKPQVEKLVICLSEIDYFGSEFVGALVTMMREMRTRNRKACLCSARPQSLQILQNMALFKLWPYFPTRDAALAIQEQPVAPVG